MRYVVYIDRLFLLQFVQSCILLLLTRAFLHSAAALKRIVFASAAGALLFCMILLLPDAGRRMKILLFACSSLVTLGMAFRIRTLQHFCKAVILYHGAAFLLAGALNALYGAFGRAPFMDTIQASACAAAIGVTVLCVLRWEKIKREEIVITVILEEGSVQVTLKALIDSGNSLYDPISGKPVCVVEREAPEGKIPLDIPEKFRLIPYHSIGKKHGMMQAVEIEKLKVKKDGQELIVEKALLGLYENKVTAHGGYQMILHPALFENRRNGHDIKSRNTRKNAV